MLEIQKINQLGENFELQLINIIIGEKEIISNKSIRRNYRDGLSIIPNLDGELFEDEYSKKLFVVIYEYYQKYTNIPYYNEILTLLRSKKFSSIELKVLEKQLDKVENVPIFNKQFIIDSVSQFVTFKRFELALKYATRQYRNMNLDALHNVPALMQKALRSVDGVGDIIAMGEGDVSDLNHSRSDTIIPTGIGALDDVLGGGIGLGELGIVIAGMKVGKTTSAVIKGFNAAMAGFVVLHIFSEDTEAQIKMKYRSKASNVDLIAMRNVSKRNKDGSFSKHSNRAVVIKRTDEKLKAIREKGGMIIPVKLRAGEFTVDDIEGIIDKCENIGVLYPDSDELIKVKIHLLIVDYFECTAPKGNYQKDYEGHKEIARDYEKLIQKREIACWLYTQGNRSSLDSDIVTTSQTSGSITKLQIAHILLSYAKTLEQRANGQANIAVLGSRVGRDGILFENCDFDNAKMLIDIPDESIPITLRNKSSTLSNEYYDEDTGEAVSFNQNEDNTNSNLTSTETVFDDDDDIPF